MDGEERSQGVVDELIDGSEGRGDHPILEAGKVVRSGVLNGLIEVSKESKRVDR